MRILEFNVNKQRLTKQKVCDFSGLVSGSVGYLKAKFDFSHDDWEPCTIKIARFWFDDNEHAAYLDENGCCEIPPEVLTGERFSVSVLGAAPGYKIETNKIKIVQEGH